MTRVEKALEAMVERERGEKVAYAVCERHGARIPLYREPTHEQSCTRDEFFLKHANCRVVSMRVLRS